MFGIFKKQKIKKSYRNSLKKEIEEIISDIIVTISVDIKDEIQSKKLILDARKIEKQVKKIINKL